MPHVPSVAPQPDRREVKITVFASLGLDERCRTRSRRSAG